MIRPGTLVAAQAWKFWLGIAVLMGGSVLMQSPGLFYPVQREIGVLLGTAIAAVALVWLAVSIRCPKCHLKLFYYAMSTQTPRGWLGWLLDASKCPRCAYEVEGKA
jgi:hypothetical protein